MKYALYYSIFLFSFVSCSKPNYYQLRINDIPTKSPNYNAQILFLGEKLPTEPYFEVIDFEVHLNGKFNKQDIRRRMEIEAIKEGVDAIVNVEARTEVIETGNIFTVLIDMMDEDNETTTITTNQTFIYGKGIMYLNNLDYISHQPEYEYYYKITPDSGFPEPFFKVEYKLTGQVYMVYPETEYALEIFKEKFQYYSDFHLLKQREMWTYKKKQNNLVKRTLRNDNGVITKVCVPEYDLDNRIVRLKISNKVKGVMKVEYVNYSYDPDGNLLNRLVEEHDGTKIYEKYNYEENRLIGKKILLNLSDGSQVHLNTSIRYYDPNYLKDLYFNEIVKQNQRN